MNVLVPIAICAILPISIVAIVFITAINSENKRAQVLIKAIESGNGVDADKLAEAMRKPRKSARQVLQGRLLKGCIFTFIGLFIIAVGIANLCMGTEFDADQVTVPLLFGGISLAVGLAFLVVYFATRNSVE